MAKLKSNDVVFVGGKGVVLNGFIFDVSSLHTRWAKSSHKPEPMPEMDVTFKNGYMHIQVECVRVGNTWSAEWFSGTVGGNVDKMMRLDHPKEIPPEMLNLAYSGKILIDGSPYDLALGQGHYGTTNPWWVASPLMQVENQTEPKAAFGDRYWIEGASPGSINGFRIALRSPAPRSS